MVVIPSEVQRYDGVGSSFQYAGSPSSTLRAGSSILPLTAAAAFNSENLELAARLIDVCQQNDYSSEAHDLKTKLRLNPCRLVDQPTLSGLNDADYPNLEAFGLKDVHREFTAPSPVCVQPLPQELLDQLGRMQCNFSMGLFPEISRAWVTVDNDLFVWNYETNSDLAYFDGVENTILLVGLVKPKPNVFAHSQSSPAYILCVITAVDVLLLAVNFTHASGQPLTKDYHMGEMHLIRDPLYRLSLDGAFISDILSTNSGRIFLAARDSCLYEIDYQPRGLIFGQSCKKINHSKGIMSYLVPSLFAFTFGKNEPLSQTVQDENRHILYTRSESGSLQVFDLGSDGQQPASRVAVLTANEIQYAAAQIAQTVEPSNFKLIVHISSISDAESSCVNLVGVTQTGVRLFFTCYYVDPLTTPTPSLQRPTTLRLVHVRLPPGFSANASIARPQFVHLGHFKRDMTGFVSAVDEETDAVWLLSSAQFGFQPELMETQISAPVRGRTWSLVEAASDISALDQFELWRQRSGVNTVRPPTVVTQHMELPRRLVALTAQGIHFFQRLRPLDLLRSLLSDHGADSFQLRAFFRLFNPDQACAMCVALACSTTFQNIQLIENATRSLFAFGGEPTALQTGYPNNEFSGSSMTFGRIGQQDATNFNYRQPFQYQAVAPSQQPILSGDTNLNTTYFDAGSRGPAGARSGVDVKFSSRHNGLYAYFSRILGPIWQMRLTTEKPATTLAGKPVLQVASILTPEELLWICDQLERFLALLTGQSIIPNAPSMMGLGEISTASVLPTAAAVEAVSAQARQQLSRRLNAEATNAERLSLLRLVDLVRRCMEVFGLWRILTEHQLHVVLSFLPNDLRDLLKSMTVRNLVVSGKDLCSDLITCVISTYLGDRAATDAISERLKKACPSLFTSDDATAAKASELLQLARDVDDGQLKAKTIADALAMYKRVAGQIHLPTVCLQFESAECYDGVLDLCLCAAQKIDPQNAALHYLKTRDAASGSFVDEKSEFRDIYVARMNCYKCVTDMFNHIMGALSGRHPKLTTQAAQEWIDRLLKIGFESSDELCHTAIFNWMVENRLDEQLLNAPSVYLENYLQRCISACSPNDEIQYLNLLWKYYEKDGRFLQAAQLLIKLADRRSASLSLGDRIDYLSRAVVCAKSSSTASSPVAELLHELEDKLEVAKLQAQILDSLKQLRQSNSGYVREAIAKLNAELMDVTKLFADFAEEFNLSESKLAILHCAGHYDQVLVETLWREIIDKELCVTTDQSAAVRSKLLATKLTSLGTMFMHSPRYFPGEFLTRYLLLKAYENGFDAFWFTRTLRAMGIPFSMHLSELTALYKSKDPTWHSTRRAQLYLLRCVLGIISVFVETPTAVASGKDIPKLVNQCLDVISYFAVELRSMATSSETIAVIQAFDSMQLKLENMLK